MKLDQRRRAILAAASSTIALVAPTNVCAAGNTFDIDNLVSDLPGIADHQDLNLVNPWGLALSATSPFWAADNGTGVSTLYDGTGAPRPLVVVTPPAAGGTEASPTGIVFNGGNGFELAPNRPARFIFASEQGVISAWNPMVNATEAIRKVDNSAADAVYKGLAIANNGTGDFLYATDFAGGKIDVFDSNFNAATLSGSFTDPGILAGFSPFNIQALGDKLYVTYALKEAGGDDDVAGPGNGFVDVFDLNGNMLQRLISQGALNSPWGLEIAPEDFGPFEGKLLVGNFGDGKINVYDPVTGALVDTLKDTSDNPLQIEGLWALKVGNGSGGGDDDDIYFTAGISGGGAVEDHGLFGEISLHIPDGGASTGLLLGATVLGLAASRRKQT